MSCNLVQNWCMVSNSCCQPTGEPLKNTSHTIACANIQSGTSHLPAGFQASTQLWGNLSNTVMQDLKLQHGKDSKPQLAPMLQGEATETPCADITLRVTSRQDAQQCPSLVPPRHTTCPPPQVLHMPFKQHYCHRLSSSPRSNNTIPRSILCTCESLNLITVAIQ
jgi:hypothetical protein